MPVIRQFGCPPSTDAYSPGIRYTKFGQLFQCAERPISSCVLIEAIPHCAITGIRGGRYARSEQRKEVVGDFGVELVDAMRRVLNKGDSIILFQNRRGFSTYQQCQTCGHGGVHAL